MMTWQIMIGAQLISILVSAGVVLKFMFSKKPLDIEAEEPASVLLRKSLAHGTV